MRILTIIIFNPLIDSSILRYQMEFIAFSFLSYTHITHSPFNLLNFIFISTILPKMPLSSSSFLDTFNTITFTRFLFLSLSPHFSYEMAKKFRIVQFWKCSIYDKVIYIWQKDITTSGNFMKSMNHENWTNIDFLAGAIIFRLHSIFFVRFIFCFDLCKSTWLILYGWKHNFHFLFIWKSYSIDRPREKLCPHFSEKPNKAK